MEKSIKAGIWSANLESRSEENKPRWSRFPTPFQPSACGVTAHLGKCKEV